MGRDFGPFDRLRNHRSDASANGGQLTKEQEECARLQLDRIQSRFNQNLIRQQESR